MTDSYFTVIAGVGSYLTQFATDAANGVPFEEALKKVSENSAELAQLRATITAQAQRIAELEATVEQARYIISAIDNSGADSQLCDISVRRPSDIYGVWICDAATQWIDLNPAPAEPRSIIDAFADGM
jgi:hypothetical protein